MAMPGHTCGPKPNAIWRLGWRSILNSHPAGVPHGNGASGGSRGHARVDRPGCRHLRPRAVQDRHRRARVRRRCVAAAWPRRRAGLAPTRGRRGFESDRRAFVLAQRLPLQAVAHPGRSRTLAQLLVDGLHPCRFPSRSQASRHRPRRPTSRRIVRQPATSGRFCWRASTRC